MVKEYKRGRIPGKGPKNFLFFAKIISNFLEYFCSLPDLLNDTYIIIFLTTLNEVSLYIVDILCFWFDPFIPSSAGCPAYHENEEIRKMSGKWRDLAKNRGKLRIMDRFS